MLEFSQFTNTVSNWFTGVLPFGDSATTSETTSSSGESTEQNNDQSLGFDNWLTAALSNSDSSDTSEATEGISSAIETGLFSAMGLGSSGISLETLTSDSSLSTIQSSLLSALQTDLFSQSGTVASDVLAGTDAVESVTDESFFSGLYTSLVGEDGATLDDMFDTINILNHIPVVNDVYEGVTDNHVDLAAGLVGGYLYGGPIGAAYEGIDFIVEQTTGQSMFQNLKSMTYDAWFGSEDAELLSTAAEGISDDVSNAAYDFVTRDLTSS